MRARRRRRTRSEWAGKSRVGDGLCPEAPRKALDKLLYGIQRSWTGQYKMKVFLFLLSVYLRQPFAVLGRGERHHHHHQAELGAVWGLGVL
jgi:hypothetical protein